MSVRIAQASIDERGKASGGVAGNQTGKELNIKPWYDKKWDCVMRFVDKHTAIKASEIMTKLVNCNLIGYDQSQRNTLYEALKSHKFNVDAYIKSKKTTECDCSSLVIASLVAAGIDGLKYTGNAPTTHVMKQTLKNVGFIDISALDKHILTNQEYLQKGDVIIKAGSHVAMAIDAGKYATVPQNRPDKSTEYYPAYTGNSKSIIDALKSVGETDTSIYNRAKIAYANGFTDGNYIGTIPQNNELMRKIKAGELKRYK